MNKTQLPFQTITAADLRQQEDLLLIDVRTPREYAERHIAGTQLLPLHTLDPESLRPNARDRSICLICQSGGRARQAAAKLAAAGFEKINILDGGIEAWNHAGLPLQFGPKGISLERQTRIAAGTLILLGLAGAWLLHPAFLALSGFVGAGLIFAGVSGWCGMGLLLARMPWNNAQPSCSLR